MAARNKNSQELPPSREVRLAEGVLIGHEERIAFDIYTGDAGTLASSMVKLELVIELREARAIQAFAALIRRKLTEDGYIVVSDIDECQAKYHEERLLGPSNPVVPDETWTAIYSMSV